MVKSTILILLFAVCFSSQLLAEETSKVKAEAKAEIVQIAKPATREVHPQTGRPIYTADEEIPAGISGHIREKDGTYRGAGVSTGVILCSSGSCSIKTTSTTWTCSGGSCGLKSSSSASKPALRAWKVER